MGLKSMVENTPEIFCNLGKILLQNSFMQIKSMNVISCKRVDYQHYKCDTFNDNSEIEKIGKGLNSSKDPNNQSSL